MSNKKQPASIVRSSAAEYLTFVAATGDQKQSVEMRYEDENIWLTQKMMAALYDVTVPAINQHLKRVFDDGELLPEAVIKDYLITARDGKNYRTKHYNLQAIITVGFKIPRSTLLRGNAYHQHPEETPILHPHTPTQHSPASLPLAPDGLFPHSHWHQSHRLRPKP